MFKTIKSDLIIDKSSSLLLQSFRAAFSISKNTSDSIYAILWDQETSFKICHLSQSNGVISLHAYQNDFDVTRTVKSK